MKKGIRLFVLFMEMVDMSGFTRTSENCWTTHLRDIKIKRVIQLTGATKQMTGGRSCYADV